MYNFYWASGSSSTVPTTFCLPILPSARVFSWSWIIIFILNFGMMLEIQVTLCMMELHFLEKLLLPQTMGKWIKTEPKIKFF